MEIKNSIDAQKLLASCANELKPVVDREEAKWVIDKLLVAENNIVKLHDDFLDYTWFFTDAGIVLNKGLSVEISYAHLEKVPGMDLDIWNPRTMKGTLKKIIVSDEDAFDIKLYLEDLESKTTIVEEFNILCFGKPYEADSEGNTHIFDFYDDECKEKNMKCKECRVKFKILQ